MAIISKEKSILQEENIYFQKFVAKNGDKYGLRFGEPKDAQDISLIYREIYGYEYVNPLVYDVNLLKRELSEKNKFWFVGESLKNREIAGAGLLEKERFIVKASKAVTKKKFQGQGITTKIGAAGITTATKMPQFQNILRLDFEVRGPEIGAQKLAQYAGALPYCLIPGYANFGDRRHFNIEDNKPFPSHREEAVFLYSILFKTLWKNRKETVYLLDDEDIIFFYEFIKKLNKKMQDDVLFLRKENKDKGYELYGVSKDLYTGIVNLYGYIKQKSLINLLKVYKDWRIILWRIPTNINGIASMTVAKDIGFNVVGYDIGFNKMKDKLYDSVILAYYPNGGSQIFEVNYLEENKPLFNKVREIFFSRVN
jgi:hypothetical protein